MSASTLTTFSAKQAQSFHRATRRINLWHGSIRSGKTFVSILRWMHWVATEAPDTGALVMIGNTRDTLGRNVLDVIAEIDPDSLRWNRGAPTARLYGRLVHIIGASDVRAENRIRGLTVAGAYVDEVTLLQEAMWTQLLGRMSVPGAMLFGTTNPDSPAHWLRKKYLKRAGKLDMRFWHFELADNPSLSAEYVAAISAEFTGLWFERFIKGRWVAAEGAIYSSLSEKDNAVPRPDQWTPLCIGVDYGTSNPTHAVLLSLNEPKRRLHAISEWRHDGRADGALTDDEVSKRLTSWVDGLGIDRSTVPIILDPSAASLRAQLRKDGWLVKSADNTVLDALRETASLFARRHLVVDTKHCTHLWDELLGYVWDSKASDDGVDRPLKENDHGCLVAGTRVTTRRGDLPIEQVRPGDLVLTRNGWRPVLVAGMTQPAASIWRAELSNGQTIEGTADHPIWTGEWTPLADTAYRTVSTCPTQVSHAHRLAAFGGRLTALSRPVTRFTTVTATRGTTTSTTLNVSRSLNTKQFTARKAANVAALIRNGLTALVRPQPNGIDLTRAASGTANTGSEPGRNASINDSPATNAKSSSTHSPGTARNGSAQTPASQRGAEPLGSTTRPGNANDAVSDSPRTSTAERGVAPVRVLRVTATNKHAPVFNLRVLGTHEFYANGVLVSNCDSLRYAVRWARRYWRDWLAPEAEPQGDGVLMTDTRRKLLGLTRGEAA